MKAFFYLVIIVVAVLVASHETWSAGSDAIQMPSPPSLPGYLNDDLARPQDGATAAHRNDVATERPVSSIFAPRSRPKDVVPAYGAGAPLATWQDGSAYLPAGGSWDLDD